MIKRTDSNQKEIVESLRGVGFSVAVTSNVGKGFPDIVAGGNVPCPHCRKKFPQNKFLEIKSNEKAVLTEDQKKFHALWRGEINTVCSVNQVFDLLGVFLKPKQESAIKTDRQVLLDTQRTLRALLQNVERQLQI